ncbi:hypothetical protein FRUB_00695 [Fimbriiglobus ruber]|uniref:Peptidase M48 domain-containing protein n=1 Tax=Fimbriiglobus ruber TaxID=1908690 RepID=A0A225EAD5_9BACT|nr:hypothetical protein FRUB_00695 [Fimbriiglobus ruber]
MFLVKGLFKRQRTDLSRDIRLERNEQPELFRFIDRLCEETSAPKPAGIYLSTDVNATVIVNTSLINLVMPPQKQLRIGAGLVNAVNLREFKATLAHEFGHFSQKKTLSIHTYVYVANRVLRDVVYARDTWDDWLDRWCGMDIRVSFPAWVLRGVVWVLRGLLGLVFKGINLLHLSLRRQMEFNADDVAVSVAGSDAVATLLCRIEFADQCQELTAHDLRTAAVHGLYSRDVLYHQDRAAAHLRAVNRKPEMGIPPTPPTQVFDPNDTSTGSVIWDSHPTNHDREANAKRYYLPTPPDDRTPWLLFRDMDFLRVKLSESFYLNSIGKPVAGVWSAPEYVQAFIDAERAVVGFDPKYHGLFDDRLLRLPNLDSVPTPDLERDIVDRLAAFFTTYPPADLVDQMRAHHQRREEAKVLEGYRSGNAVLKGHSFPFRGRQAAKKEIPKLLKDVSREMEADQARFADWDQAMGVAHYQAGYLLDPSRGGDLGYRYAFQMSLQSWINILNRQQDSIQATLEWASDGELTEEELSKALESLRTAGSKYADCLAKTEMMLCPEMSNIEYGQRVAGLIRPDNWTPPQFGGDDASLTAAIQHLIIDYQTTLHGLRRLFFKGLVSILTRQEQIATDFTATVSKTRAAE